MEASIFETIGQVAGIGGISLGVLLFIFRDVVRKSIFPNLSQVQGYRIIRLVVVLTFLIAASGIASWVYVQTSAANEPRDPVFPQDSPDVAIRNYVELIDADRFSDAWSSMSKEGHKRFQYDFLKQAYEGARKPLGRPSARTLLGITTLKQLPDQTRGAFATASFVTRFERAGAYQEAVTVIAENGIWKVLFHQLAPCQPGICQ